MHCNFIYLQKVHGHARPRAGPPRVLHEGAGNDCDGRRHPGDEEVGEAEHDQQGIPWHAKRREEGQQDGAVAQDAADNDEHVDGQQDEEHEPLVEPLHFILFHFTCPTHAASSFTYSQCQAAAVVLDERYDGACN